MKNQVYMKKWLTDLYEADRVFMKVLENAQPLPRMRKAVNQLLDEASSHVQYIEKQMIVIGK